MIQKIRQILCNDRLFIKWVVDSQIPSKENVLELEQAIPKSIRDESSLQCSWNKLNSKNTLIDESNHDTQNNYVYKRLSNYCNLLILNYNFETNEQIDFYKPVLKTRLDSEDYVNVVYALAYLKSFEIVKKEHNSVIDKYKCRAIVIVPYSSIESLNNKTEESLAQNVGFFFNLMNNKKVLDRINSRNVISKRDTKHFISITLESDEIDVMNKVGEIATCELNLFDEKKRELYFKHFIHENFTETYEGDQDDSRNGSENLQPCGKILIFLLILIFKFSY